MKRLLAFVIAAGIETVACGSGTSPILTSPSQQPVAIAVSADADPAIKHHAIGGMVMSVEKPTRGIAGALVEVTGGADAGMSTVSDADGSFLLPSLTGGSVSLRISKSGFQPWALNGLFLDNDKKIGAELFPTPPTDASGQMATGRCSGGTWTWAQTVEEACTRNGGLAYGVCPGPLCKG